MCEGPMGPRSFTSDPQLAPVNFQCARFKNDNGDCEPLDPRLLRTRIGIDGHSFQRFGNVNSYYQDASYGTDETLTLLYLPQADWRGKRPRVNVLSGESLKVEGGVGFDGILSPWFLHGGVRNSAFILPSESPCPRQSYRVNMLSGHAVLRAYSHGDHREALRSRRG